MSAGAASVAPGTVCYEMGLVRVEAAGSPGAGTIRFAPGPRRLTPTNGITVISSTSPKVIRAVNQRPIFAIQPKGMTGIGPQYDYGVKSRPNQVLAVSGSSKLKELLLTQLDLIQKQSEALLKKDKQLQELQKENRDLVSKLKKFNELPVEDPPAKKRRKVDKCVETSKELLESEPLPKKSRKSKYSSRKPEILETQRHYFTHNGEEHARAERESVRDILRQSEVPQWKVNPVSPSNEISTEKLDEDFILKRHKKPEVQEKQRKRWDMQRMRQLKQVEHLRARYDSATSALEPEVNFGQGDGSSISSETSERIKTFYPDPFGVRQIVVAETFPVSAFGYPLPNMGQETFSLPWSSSCD